MPRRAAESSGYLIVGRIRKPHGVRGELVVGLESDHPERIFTVGRSLLLGGDDARPLAGSLTIERARPFRDDGMLVRFAELTTLDASLQALRGRTLLIPEEEAAPLADDEIFYHQLVGMRVVVEGREIGTVRDVFPTAAADLLQVMRPGGRELLVPFSGEFVVGWDRDAGVLELEPPPGLMEL
jgi:16S rRNA processing protein RimM